MQNSGSVTCSITSDFAADVFCAAFLGRLDALRAHIAEGLADVQSPHEDFHPVTPLHYAVDGGSVAAARLLLASGADARTPGGRLLTSAASQGSIELVRLLLDQGAEAAARSPSARCTPTAGSAGSWLPGGSI